MENKNVEIEDVKKKIATSIALSAVIAYIIAAFIIIKFFDVTVNDSFFALTPPIIAIALALITKEVYSSLFIGIVSGALLVSGYSVTGTLNTIFTDGIISCLSDSWNVGILVFLVILGTMVQLMNSTGGSKAFGDYAASKIKTRVGAQLVTILLGVLIFIDDYFNCLTVGSVMKPVTDKHKISRAKLAYLIDSTAAPVCIIAPISSWAAAVSGFVDGENGLSLFIRTIPYNFYALFTILMMIMIVTMKFDFGQMADFEYEAMHQKDMSSLDSDKTRDDDTSAQNGKIVDMLFPIFALIIFCTIGMAYTGGFFEGIDFVTAISNSDASVGLVLGSFIALVITIFFYVVRGVLEFNKCMECLPEGFKQMVPAILILTLAWSLKGMTDMLGAATFVESVVRNSAGGFMNFMPCIIFVIAIFLAFATGTSWGTFGILIPIVVALFQHTDYTLMIISMSACMAGAVCGDHCSPISDTTIMSSAGASCNHLNHVVTQLPYAMLVASISFVLYLIAGFVKDYRIVLPIGIVLLYAILRVFKAKKAEKHEDM